jgi:hypothetical protein
MTKHLTSIKADHTIFIDPYPDPEMPQYRDLPVLLQHAGGRSPAPKAETHRVVWRGTSLDERPPSKELDGTSRCALEMASGHVCLAVEILLREDLHDRSPVPS